MMYIAGSSAPPLSGGQIHEIGISEEFPMATELIVTCLFPGVTIEPLLNISFMN